MNSSDIFKILTQSEPLSLIGLPDTFGIYALWDHEGMIRYIGCTPKATEGFRIRVGNKHVTGSEGRSHKFSQAYCTGRMWRYCKKLAPEAALSVQDPLDAKRAKKLRTEFIRKHCGITYVELPPSQETGNYFNALTTLEAEVQQMASPEMRAWEGVSFQPFQEPIELVDSLLTSLPHLRGFAERQANIFNNYVLK